MTREELILSYGSEEIGINLYNANTEKPLMYFIWKTDYTLINSNTKKYINAEFHLYDDNDVYSWDIKDGELFIYIDL